MSRQIRGKGDHLVFPISPKNTKLAGDAEIFLPVMFHLILVNGFIGEVENASAKQSPRPEKHKLEWFFH